MNCPDCGKPIAYVNRQGSCEETWTPDQGWHNLNLWWKDRVYLTHADVTDCQTDRWGAEDFEEYQRALR